VTSAGRHFADGVVSVEAGSIASGQFGDRFNVAYAPVLVPVHGTSGPVICQRRLEFDEGVLVADVPPVTVELAPNDSILFLAVVRPCISIVFIPRLRERVFLVDIDLRSKPSDGNASERRDLVFTRRAPFRKRLVGGQGRFPSALTPLGGFSRERRGPPEADRPRESAAHGAARWRLALRLLESSLDRTLAGDSAYPEVSVRGRESFQATPGPASIRDRYQNG
jgi:hypothetical protein